MQQDTEEWRAWRKSGIGASEVAALLGICPYNTAYGVWLVKTGRSKGFAGNSFTEHGKALESTARARYELANMIDMEPRCATHPVYAHCLASLDGWNEELKKILEIKCPKGRQVIDAALAGRVAEHYVPQVQFQMAVTGAEELDFYVYHSDSQADATVTVKPDVAYQGNLIMRVEDFWKAYVERDIAPPLTDRDVLVLDENPQLVKLANALTRDDLTDMIRDQLKSDFIAIGGHPKVKCGRVQVSTVNRQGKFSYHKLTVSPEVDSGR